MNLQDLLIECKNGNEPIFYSLSNLTYICIQTALLEKGHIVKNSVSIYVPTELTKTGGLVCNDVSMAFPLQSRNALANNCLNYAFSRI